MPGYEQGSKFTLSTLQHCAHHFTRYTEQIFKNLQVFITTRRDTFTALYYMLPIFVKPVIVIWAEPAATAHRVMFYTVLKCKWVQILFDKFLAPFLLFGQCLFANHIGFDWQLLSHAELQHT